MNVNTVIVGIQKARITSFYDWLGQHPDVYAPKDAKDYHFFSNDEYYNRGYENLLSRYPDYNNERIVLHAGVNYSFFHSYTYQRLHEYNPNLKVIIILRNPVDRAISAYNYFKRLNPEERDITNVFNRDEELELKGYHNQGNFTYLNHGYYSSQIKVLYKLFPQKHIKNIFFEDLLNRKRIVYQEVLAFLGVKNEFLPDFKHENVSGSARLNIINKVLWNPALKGNLKKIIPYHLILNEDFRGGIFKILNKINTSKRNTVEPEQNDLLKKELNKIYKTEVDDLSELLNLDLKEKWGIK